jgi:hypothetical protein
MLILYNPERALDWHLGVHTLATVPLNAKKNFFNAEKSHFVNQFVQKG